MSVDRTVAFVDLVRFTTLTDVHGDEAAVGLLDDFVDATERSLSSVTRLVKRLGDGLLLASSAPHALLRDLAAAFAELRAIEGFPQVAGGVHEGPVVERIDDVLGATVNIAARLAEVAAPGRLCVTQPVAGVAAELDMAVEPLGPMTLRGVLDTVELFSVDPCDRPDRTAADPVCGMRITPGPATPRHVDRDGTVWFCTEVCRDIFEREPSRYLGPDASRRLEGGPTGP